MPFGFRGWRISFRMLLVVFRNCWLSRLLSWPSAAASVLEVPCSANVMTLLRRRRRVCFRLVEPTRPMQPEELVALAEQQQRVHELGDGPGVQLHVPGSGPQPTERERPGRFVAQPHEPGAILDRLDWLPGCHQQPVSDRGHQVVGARDVERREQDELRLEVLPDARMLVTALFFRGRCAAHRLHELEERGLVGHALEQPLLELRHVVLPVGEIPRINALLTYAPGEPCIRANLVPAVRSQEQFRNLVYE